MALAGGPKDARITKADDFHYVDTHWENLWHINGNGLERWSRSFGHFTGPDILWRIDFSHRSLCQQQPTHFLYGWRTNDRVGINRSASYSHCYSVACNCFFLSPSLSCTENLPFLRLLCSEIDHWTWRDSCLFSMTCETLSKQVEECFESSFTKRGIL